MPYVAPDAARLLNRIGERLHEELRAAGLPRSGLPRYRSNISSVLRTAENQQALRRINSNAARSVSAHEFGTTLEVVVQIYGYVPRSEDAISGTAYPLLNERLAPCASGCTKRTGCGIGATSRGIWAIS